MLFGSGAIWERCYLGVMLFGISIPGDEILDSDWLTAVHYLSIMDCKMIVCLRDGRKV